MTKIIVCGACGRMGEKIIELILRDKEAELTGAIEAKNHPFLGKNITPKVKVTDDLEKLIGQCDVVVDFTIPGATMEHMGAVASALKAMVIGTTGFSDEELQTIKKLSEKTACVMSPNMSPGVNLLFKISEEAAALLKGYDVEIIEVHHNKKKDAPSGTARKLAEKIALAQGSKSVIYGRSKTAPVRKQGEICIHAVRAGDVVGEHTVVFAGEGERIELVHKAQSRDNFSCGAVMAAKWVRGRHAGLYDMADVLGLKKG